MGTRRIARAIPALLCASAMACSTSEGSQLEIVFANQDGLSGLTAVVNLEDDAPDNFAIPPAGATRSYDVEAGHQFTIQIFQNESATNARHCTVSDEDIDDGTVTFAIDSDGDGGLGELFCW